ncbi:MAG: GNAT family N-acetyltransferase [Methanosphaera stadtmanae]|nr:GNAT family N-acetyltransferase [Methanosphaera stadtmanae]
MNIQILELNETLQEKYEVKKFIFKMIKESYGLDYVPKYHYDVIGLEEYYIKPKNSNFYIAINENDKLVATAAVRGYDRDYHIKNRNYNKISTASIYRLFVDPEYRHNKIAMRMIKNIENFCKKQDYNEIYLHTQKNSYGALPFWIKQGYIIVDDTHNEMGTIHMEKVIKNPILIKNQIKNLEKIEIT